MIKNYSLNTYLRTLLALLFVCLLSACGSNGSSEVNTNTINGNAVKGVISNGIVNAFSVAPSTNEMTFLSATRTDQFGAFSLNLSQESPDTFILLELRSDEHSSMLCDLMAGCTSPTSGNHVSFGESITLESSFRLLGTLDPNDPTNAFISPLSHIIISTASTLTDGLNAKNIGIATEWLSDSFGISHNPLSTKTPDITRLDELESLAKSELSQAIYSAVFFDLTYDTAWENNALSVDDLPYDALFSLASELSSSLVSHYSDSGTYSSVLSVINAEANELLEQVTSAGLAIITQPSSDTGSEGDNLALWVRATSTQEINYQWYKGAELISGATDSLLSIDNASLGDAGIYNVRVSNSATVIQSLNALITVNEISTPLYFVQQPSSISLTTGQALTLSALASGQGTLRYQWQKAGSLIPGANQANYQVNSVSLDDAGAYQVIVSDESTQLSSQLANVYVSDSTAPVTIIEHPASLTTIQGSEASFSILASGGGFISYQWRFDGSNISGATETSLLIASTEESDSGSYDVIVSNSQGNAQSLSATLNVLPNQVPLSISQQPQSISRKIGDSSQFSVTALGGSSLSYQWYFNGSQINGATQATYTIASTSVEDEGLYSVDVSSGDDRVTSLSALLTVLNNASLALSWQVPTQRENGDTLLVSEISGYVIQYGDSADSLDNSITITDALTTDYELNGLQSGTVFLRIATVDSDDIQGQYSSTISIDIP